MALVRCLILATALPVAFAMVACGEPECDPCTQDNPCPDLTGEYYGELTERYDNCDAFILLAGETSIRVLSQTNDADDKQTSLNIEGRDNHGRWGTYDGYLCNTTDEGENKQYVFHVEHRPTYDPDAAYQARYRIDGYFLDQGEEIPPEVHANLNISIRMNDDNERCMLRGSLDATRTE